MFVEELRNNDEWEGFLQNSPDGTFYHSLKWREVIQKSLPGLAHYLVVKSSNGSVVGICPAFIQKHGPIKVFTSMPYSDYGGPIIREGYFEKASVLLRKFIEEYCFGNGISFAKIRFVGDRLGQFFKLPLSYVDTGSGVMVIDLKAKSSDIIWNEIFSSKQRYEIRRFERGGFNVREASNESDLKDFYNLYLVNMRNISASGYPYIFFRNIWNTLFPENFSIILLEKEKCLGGLAQFKYKNSFYGGYVAIDRNWSWGRYSLMSYMIWQLIKKAEEIGIRYVSLGSTPSYKKHPHYIQKNRFGPTFMQQEWVFTPFGYGANFLVAAWTKTIPVRRLLKQCLPTSFNIFMERKLAPFFVRF